MFCCFLRDFLIGKLVPGTGSELHILLFLHFVFGFYLFLLLFFSLEEEKEKGLIKMPTCV